MFNFTTTQINSTDYQFNAGSAKNKLSNIINDLPSKCYVNKSITGCGATTVAIVNDVDYLILVPYISLIESKVAQHPELLPIHGTVNPEAIKEYVETTRLFNKPLKMIATYDALKALIEKCDILSLGLKLMVDEAHLLVNLASFKANTCQYILDHYTDFNEYVFVTATPTRREFFPSKIETLPLLNIVWDDVIEANFKTYYLDSDTGMTKKLVAICLGALLDDEERELHIFYNSVQELLQVILRLKANDDIDLNRTDFRLVCSKSQQSKVNDVLGKKFFGKINTLVDPVRKLNFYTSTAFEGGDVYSNLPESCEQYICVNGSRDHTKLDFTSTVSQIVGRVRNKVDNNIHFLISNSPESTQYTEEEWADIVVDRIESANRLVNDVYTNTTISPELKEAGLKTALTNHYTYFNDETNTVQVSDVAFKFELQSYQALHAKYLVQATETENPVASNLNSILTEVGKYDNFNIKYESVLLYLAGYKHFGEAMKYYCEFKTNGTNNKLVELLEQSSSDSEGLKYYYDNLGAEKIKALCYSEKRIIQELTKREDAEKANELSLQLEVGSFYSNKELKSLIQDFYNSSELTLTAKASDVTKWYEVTKTKKQGILGFKIDSKI